MRRVVLRAAALCAVLLTAACSEPPQKEIDLAQGALDAARAAGAEQYAPQSFEAATTAMRQTHEAVEQRDYRLALSRAIDAKERALEAATEAANGKARARSEADAAIAAVVTAQRQLEAALKSAETSRLPAKEAARARAAGTAAEAALQKARAAVERGDFLDATAATRGVSEGITREISALTDALQKAPARPARRRR